MTIQLSLEEQEAYTTSLSYVHKYWTDISSLTSSDRISFPPLAQWWQFHLPIAQVKIFGMILHFYHFFVAHIPIIHVFILAPPSKYCRNPSTSHHIQYHHPGLGHHYLPSRLLQLSLILSLTRYNLFPIHKLEWWFDTQKSSWVPCFT